MIGTFGPVTFEVSAEKTRTFDDFKRKTSVKFEQHDIVGLKPKLEFVAPGLDEISFQVIFSAFLGLSPLKEAEQLRQIVQKGEYYPLIIKGKILGNFVIESLSETWKHLDKEGNVLYIAVDISLKEYYVEPKPIKASTSTSSAAAAVAKVDKIKDAIKDQAKKAGIDKLKDIAALANAAMMAVKNPMSAIIGVNSLLKNVQGLQNVAKYVQMAKNKDVTGALNQLTSGKLGAYKIAGINVMDLAKKSQSNPKDALINVLSGVVKVDPTNRIEVAKKLFGEKAAGPVLQLAKKTEELKQEFDKGVINV